MFPLIPVACQLLWPGPAIAWRELNINPWTCHARQRHNTARSGTDSDDASFRLALNDKSAGGHRELIGRHRRPLPAQWPRSIRFGDCSMLARMRRCRPVRGRHHLVRCHAWLGHIFAGTAMKRAGNSDGISALNPRVRSSSRWRLIRSDLGFHSPALFLMEACMGRDWPG